MVWLPLEWVFLQHFSVWVAFYDLNLRDQIAALLTHSVDWSGYSPAHIQYGDIDITSWWKQEQGDIIVAYEALLRGSWENILCCNVDYNYIAVYCETQSEYMLCKWLTATIYFY